MKNKRLCSDSLLAQLRVAVPFLRQIPDKVYFGLDTSEFYLPTGKVFEARLKLEKKFNHFIMTYKRGVFNLSVPVYKHLCANIKGAALSEDQLASLQEQALHNFDVSFVVYEKPLKIINPLESSLANYYRKTGLI